jgi:hypothetical protein
LDTQTGVVYPSRVDCIKALGRDVAVPMLRDRRFKRLRVITMEDKKKAMCEQGERSCALAVIFLEATVRDIEIAAHGRYTHDDFMDVASSLRAIQEDLEGFILNIEEAGYYLDEQIELETLRNEFQLDIREDIKSMVQRL